MRRFWTDVTVVPEQEGFAILLDHRPVRTPAKAPMILPNAPLAQEVASEWSAVEGEVRPAGMPMTRSANAAIDKVAHQFDEVADMIAAYGGCDLLCYRADAPEALCQRQAEAWDPLLDWAHHSFGARLSPVTGVMPVDQDAAALAPLRRAVHASTNFQLTALHDLVALTGSLVLGLAVAHGRLDPDTAWRISRIDEDWQIEQWGEDEEAQALAASKQADLLHAARLFDLVS